MRPHSKIHSTGNEEQQTPERMRKILGSNIDWGQERKDLLLIAVQMGLLEEVCELLDQGFNQTDIHEHFSVRCRLSGKLKSSKVVCQYFPR